MATALAAAPASDAVDREVETILTSFDTNYAWNYGALKEGLRDLYEKAKREQWNGTQQLAWGTPVDPEGEILIAASVDDVVGVATASATRSALCLTTDDGAQRLGEDGRVSLESVAGEVYGPLDRRRLLLRVTVR